MDGFFALGSNGSGQLGLGHREDVSVPKPIQFVGDTPSDAIVKVAAGGNHTILLAESGRAYWSGDASNGSCGVADSLADAKFRELVISSTQQTRPITHVACTWDSSVFVLQDENGKTTQVYICGSLASGSFQRPMDATGPKGGPLLISDFPPTGTEVRDIAAGFRHVIVVLDNGDVYGWGNGRKGQLGTLEEVDHPKGVVGKPRKIAEIDFHVAAAECCQHATCLIAEPGDGRIMVLGADKWGLKSKAPMEEPNWKTITASWGGVYILKRDGKVVAWGRDDHGQLPPLGLPEIAIITAGSEHVLAVTEDGDVLAWGWGEHGNCGPSTEKFGDVKGRWNMLASLKHLSEGSKITGIGAGCATSWINIVASGIFI
ncbi:RCC1/BLIP-II [Xylariaceae sp. FL0016]|nr:RCC1/BLIP-II [Xylariaceae sp. FL0016]